MRSNTSHCTTFIQVVNHMQNESIIGRFLRCKSSGFTETIIIIELVSCTPFGRERRICNYCIKLGISKSVPFECITVFYFEVAELDSMKQHIHSGEVIR